MSISRYQNAIQSILSGNPDEALSYVRELRSDENVDLDKALQQKLVSFRLAIKNGHAAKLDQEELSPKATQDPFLKAEAHFVRGTILIHKEKTAEAAEELTTASVHYALADRFDKALLCRFNSMIAKSSGKLINSREELNLCNGILLEARNKSIINIQCLCLRQKSYLFFAQRQFAAALNEIMEALPLLEAQGTASDYHLARVHAADCAFESGDINQARLHLDYLPQQLDARLEFPKAYVLAKINETVLDIKSFENVNPHWAQRHQRHLDATQSNQDGSSGKRKYHWNKNTGFLTNERKQLVGKTKVQSLEGQLLKILSKGPMSKELICEVLWPEFATSENLDSRFFRLKSRLIQKVGQIVQFDGHNYFLTIDLIH